ncbi:hypothetical protein MKY95_21190 [Paenibacillus sp. FSL P4-0176]|uniref:hypothetical protein n=1 Tax=Paenibacillus sp. FSL P4-0176 TaxID=2921631 RepID=UPI0030CB1757
MEKKLTAEQVRELIGQEGSYTRYVTVIDAKQAENGEVNVRVRDSIGKVYWTGLDNIDLYR